MDFIAILLRSLEGGFLILAKELGKNFPNAAGKGAFPWSFSERAPNSRPMQWTERQSHLEYISKVLGVRTVLRPVSQAPQIRPLLQVVVEKEDLVANEVLFQKILAAWNLDSRFIQIEQVDSFHVGELPSSEGSCALMFTSQLEQEMGLNVIFASSLSELSESPSLKKKLWAQIQKARRDLGEITA